MSIFACSLVLFSVWQLTFCSDQQLLDFPSLLLPFHLTRCSAVSVIWGGNGSQKEIEEALRYP